MYHEYTTIGSICFKKKKRQRFSLNINRKITKLDLNQTSNLRLNLYMLYLRRSSKYFANTWQKMKRKNLLKNLNYR